MDFNLINNKVRQSNHLIESPYAQEFTVYEIKIFEIAVASCSSNDYEFFNIQRDKSFSMSNGELAKLLNTKPNVISMEIEKTAARIMKKTMHLRKVCDDGEIEFEMINIIPYARYKDGIFYFRLNYAILPYLIEINKNFTEFYLHYLLNINSAHAIKLYKLLYQYKNIKCRTFKVDELKEQFGILGKYPQYKNLKQKVIEPSIKQINLLTDLNVKYNEIKLGRKVEKLEFKFELKKAEKLILKEPEIIDIKPAISTSEANQELNTELSIQTKALINKYQQEKGFEYVDASINYAKRNAKTNLDKYLSDTLVNGWAEVEIKKAAVKKETELVKVINSKKASAKKLQDKEQENRLKSEIEHEWNKLLDLEKNNYLNYAEFILKKYSSKLASFEVLAQNLGQKLPLIIFAVSNSKSYDKALESYVEKGLNISLNVYNYISDSRSI